MFLFIKIIIYYIFYYNINLILFLFYNTELLEICNSTKVKVNSLTFVDNVNMLVYKLITEENYKQLKAVHDKYFF